MRRKIFTIFAFFALLASAFALAGFVHAQGLDVGTNEINNSIALSATDPRVTVARIINFILLFLGVIAVALFIYAGFIWMTSNGSEEKIEQAKKILRNAVIGLVIVLSAWGVVTFIMNKLLKATGNAGNNSFNSNTNYSASLGSGALGSCSLQRVYPEDGQSDVARNTSIMATFKEPLNLASVCTNASGQACACNQSDCNLINSNNIRIFKKDVGDACSSGTCPSDNTNITQAYVQASSDHKTITIRLANLLGSSGSNTDYQVYLGSGLENTNNESIFKNCRSDYMEWGFNVSNKLDLTPPQVAEGSMFPLPDNAVDIVAQASPAVAAQASIKVLSCPAVYSPTQVLGAVSVPAGSGGSVTVSMSPDYHGSFTELKVVSTSDNKQAQIFSGQEVLGIAPWDGNAVTFPGMLSLSVPSHEAGSGWDISLKPEQLADTLTVGSDVYTFSSSAGGGKITINPASCDNNTTAKAIYAALSGNNQVDVNDVSSNLVSLQSKVAGSSGNNIALSTNDPQALALSAFSGGHDQISLDKVEDKTDQPRNTVIQLSFDEAVDPLLVSGGADEVAPYIRIVNADANTPSGGSCTQNSDCASYSCKSGTCNGDYLSGQFLISNAYKTLEFRSDQECGQNACGDKIYCLPADSHLAVELVAANLNTCQSDADCANFTPFNSCKAFSTYKTCQNADGKNYPEANLNQLDGIVDASLNSLDGNRDLFSDGPIAFYNENNKSDTNLKDKYKWSFYIGKSIKLDPPQIASITPENAATDVSTTDPIQIKFNTLMMNSTLGSGAVTVENGTTTEHKLINLLSPSTPVAYWISADNKDVSPLDGRPDTTFAYINHSPLSPSVSYKVQVGSGVKDIYQNCFKPSTGPGCTASDGQPSCCYGQATSTLSADGNCF